MIEKIFIQVATSLGLLLGLQGCATMLAVLTSPKEEVMVDQLSNTIEVTLSNDDNSYWWKAAISSTGSLAIFQAGGAITMWGPELNPYYYTLEGKDKLNGAITYATLLYSAADYGVGTAVTWIKRSNWAPSSLTVSYTDLQGDIHEKQLSLTKLDNTKFVAKFDIPRGLENTPILLNVLSVNGDNASYGDINSRKRTLERK